MPTLELTEQALRQRLEQIIGGSNSVHVWLTTPHPFLGGKTPQSYLDDGKLDVIDYIIYAIEVGQPG